MDFQSFTSDRAVRGGAKPIAVVEGQAGWVHLMRSVKPRDVAAYVRLRVMPATTAPGAHGACWIDDVVLKGVEEVAEDFDTVTLWVFQPFFPFMTANVPWEIGSPPQVTAQFPQEMCFDERARAQRDTRWQGGSVNYQ